MKANLIVGVVVVGALVRASSGQAQPSMPPEAGPRAEVTSQQRFPLRVMEGVLESAVQNGAFAVGTQMRRVSPDIAVFSGPAKARGFLLEGYGVFFAVEVPALHRSITWSVRTLTQSNGDVSRALQSIRRIVQTQDDGRMKTELEQALRLVELQVGPFGAASGSGNAVAQPASIQGASAPPSSSTPPPSPVVDLPEVVADPSTAYTQAVERSLVDVMLDYGPTLTLGGTDWLTVAARENGDTILSGDLSETVTVTLRVRASDLEAFKAGRLTKAEARDRVEVRAF